MRGPEGSLPVDDLVPDPHPWLHDSMRLIQRPLLSWRPSAMESLKSGRRSEPSEAGHDTRRQLTATTRTNISMLRDMEINETRDEL